MTPRRKIKRNEINSFVILNKKSSVHFSNKILPKAKKVIYQLTFEKCFNCTVLKNDFEFFKVNITFMRKTVEYKLIII